MVGLHIDGLHRRLMPLERDFAAFAFEWTTPFLILNNIVAPTPVVALVVASTAQ